MYRTSHGDRLGVREDVGKALSDWLHVVDGQPAAGSQIVVLTELAAMLDQLRPAGLDHSRSRLAWSGLKGARGQSTAVVTLEHRTRPDWSIEINIEPTSAVISWLSAHEHIGEHDGWNDRLWTSVVVDATAAIMRGDYEVEHVTRLGQWYRTRIIDVHDPASPRLLDSSGPLWFWILRPFPGEITRGRVDFTSP
jgi:hypothetical protein